MPKTPEPSVPNLQRLLQEAVQQPLTVANYDMWRERLTSLTDDQQEQLLQLWSEEVVSRGSASDASLLWAIPLLDRDGMGPVQRQLLDLMDAMPEKLRIEFWMTALEVCDCWTAIADNYGVQLIPLVLPLLRKAAQKSALPEVWWAHWVAGVRTLLSVRAGDVVLWAPKVREVLAAGRPPEIVKNSSLMAELATISAPSAEPPPTKAQKKSSRKKSATSKNSVQAKADVRTSESPDVDVWSRFRILLQEAEAAFLQERREQEALQKQVRTLDAEKGMLASEAESLQKQLDDVVRRYKEMRLAYDELTRVHEESLVEAKQLRAELSAESRVRKEIQLKQRELEDAHQQSQAELAEWQRTAKMREHEVQNQRQTVELEFRDRLRRGPVRMADFVKNYLESLLAGDQNPEIVPLLGLSFDELHRSLLSMADLPQTSRIRQELLSKPEGS